MRVNCMSAQSYRSAASPMRFFQRILLTTTYLLGTRPLLTFSQSFILRETNEVWCSAEKNQFYVFVWLGRPATFEPPRYWLAMKREVGERCLVHRAHGTANWERRFYPRDLSPEWENRWSLFDAFRPTNSD